MANVLTNLSDYQFWRDEKLAKAASKLDPCIVDIHNPLTLTTAEKSKIQSLCQQNNFALIQTQTQADYSHAIVHLNQQLGLKAYDRHLFVNNDTLAHITPTSNPQQGEFIPYTNKAIGWHTDGYYNPPEQRIRSFSLFCVNPASSGGENSWLDNEILYILLRQQSPEAAALLTRTNAMTIPAHSEKGKILRPESTGAIFMQDNKRLYLRYTQRKKNVQFADEVRAAVALLDEILAQGSPYHFQHLITQNQGIICNNVIHKRSGFVDDERSPRLLLRGRYFERI
ncbi:TauD/TfdA family dioxygenase [Candidatus Thiodubiliella endoseptemdiera]|uniref:TauD/TfdA family dioxygenase n=1 Tax=Candidatus Thiodubiliella endoseptemdiera TaxID=2738886 RepID=UPI0034DDF032